MPKRTHKFIQPSGNILTIFKNIIIFVGIALGITAFGLVLSEKPKYEQFKQLSTESEKTLPAAYSCKYMPTKEKCMGNFTDPKQNVKPPVKASDLKKYWYCPGLSNNDPPYVIKNNQCYFTNLNQIDTAYKSITKSPSNYMTSLIPLLDITFANNNPEANQYLNQNEKTLKDIIAQYDDEGNPKPDSTWVNHFKKDGKPATISDFGLYIDTEANQYMLSSIYAIYDTDNTPDIGNTGGIKWVPNNNV